jgi:tetratricopeptide (TPR) repeat protein
MRHAYGDDAKNTDIASTLHNLGSLHKKLGDYNKAMAYYEESLAMMRHAYSDDAKNTDIAGTLRMAEQCRIGPVMAGLKYLWRLIKN